MQACRHVQARVQALPSGRVGSGRLRAQLQLCNAQAQSSPAAGVAAMLATAVVFASALDPSAGMLQQARAGGMEVSEGTSLVKKEVTKSEIKQEEPKQQQEVEVLREQLAKQKKESDEQIAVGAIVGIITIILFFAMLVDTIRKTAKP